MIRSEVFMNGIGDKESAAEIRKMTDRFVAAVDPLKVILFGSFAKGTYTDESDYDFYLVIDDGRNVGKATDEAYRGLGYDRSRPVDIVVGTNSRFETKGRSPHSLMIEREVYTTGILLYDRAESGKDAV